MSLDPARPVVAVVVPAFDEEQTIGGVLAGLPRELVRHVVVGDNGSRDRTAEIARAHGALVASAPERGYGAACAAALAALPPDTQVVVFMDADGADDPRDLPALLAPLARGEADLVIGSRPARALPGALTLPQRFGNALATTLIRLWWGQRYTDLGPLRAVRRETLAQLELRDRAFGWTVEMQVRALQCGARVTEVPVAYRRRAGGRSKVSGSLWGSVRAGYWILATLARLAWRATPRGARSHDRRGHRDGGGSTTPGDRSPTPPPA